MIKLLFLLFSGAKFAKLLTSGGTMIISIFFYAWIFGWWYAVGFVLLMFVHEMGHFIAARQRGLDVGLPTFIPFLGAWVELKDLPHDAETEAYIGLGGPLAGTVASLLCYFLARNFDSDLLMAVSYSGFFLNLFNMIPLSPFDGGRITAVLTPRIWFVGVPVLLALFFYRPSPMLIIIGFMAWPQLWRAWKYDPEAEENKIYYNMSAQVRFTYAAYYLILLAFLAVMTNDVHEMVQVARQAKGI
ncbi:site-2 protease family protein [Undibacterium sp. Di26W]|uniref:site-2 protease family protein n=1 Tax=Undibacterium sp. Di26W TaxID=3413035 RepID=UPI003BF3E7CC